MARMMYFDTELNVPENMGKLLQFLQDQEHYCRGKAAEMSPLQIAHKYRAQELEYREWLMGLCDLLAFCSKKLPKCEACGMGQGQAGAPYQARCAGGCGRGF